MKDILEAFYNCFETGYRFEEFLKVYLEKIGLDEIQVTKRSKDGGIDLIAVRNGIGDFSNSDAVNYYVQAKRFKDTKIRELKGVIPFGHKGLLITTSEFTQDAIHESNNDLSKFVTLVVGKALIRSCIENGIGFTYEPNFSEKELKNFIGIDSVVSNEPIQEVTCDVVVDQNYIEKEITENDVRARIISVPSKIATFLEDHVEYKIIFENDHFISKFIKGRNYFSAGLTNIYRKYGLLSEDNVITGRKALWVLEGGDVHIRLV